MAGNKLIMLRHGQSIWNKKNLFTGWVDVPLSREGIVEAEEAGKVLADIPIDIVFTSELTRAIMTAMVALNFHASGKTAILAHPGEGHMESWAKVYGRGAQADSIPVHRAWQLNERMYGELQGLNKAETIEKFGKEQVQIWRRSFDIAPPGGESLAMTAERSIPYFTNEIVPHLASGKNVLISAHGNSLRSIVMELDSLSKEQVVALELPTGQAIIYEYINGIFYKRPAEELYLAGK